MKSDLGTITILVVVLEFMYVQALNVVISNYFKLITKGGWRHSQL